MHSLIDIDWSAFKNAMPFVALATAKSGEKIERPLATRIIEVTIISVVSGAIAAAVSAVITLNVVENDVKHLSSSVDMLSRDLRHDIERLEGFHMGPSR